MLQFIFSSLVSPLFGERLQLTFRQFVNLTRHCTMKEYSRSKSSNHMLSEGKSKSILMPSQDITLHEKMKFSINPIQDGGLGTKKPPTSFSSVISANVGISP